MKGSQEDYNIQKQKQIEKRNQSEESREQLLNKIPAVSRLRERVDKVTTLNPRDRELEERASILPEVYLETEDKATKQHKETKQISRNLKDELDRKAEVFVKNNISLVEQIHQSKDIELKQQSLLIHGKYRNSIKDIEDLDQHNVNQKYSDMQKGSKDEDILKSLNTMGVLSNLRSNLKISQENQGLENDYATRIQKHVKGQLTRNAFKRDIMHIKNEIKKNKSSVLELKQKSKSKSSI